LYLSAALIWPCANSASASSRITGQLSRSRLSSGSRSCRRIGRFGTAENMYISTLYGAMMVEWSVIWRQNPSRTLPR
jgi:hypothetical protein